MSELTYYKRKSQCGNMDALALRHVRELEVDNKRVMRMCADLTLEITSMKDLIAKYCRAGDEAQGSQIFD